MKSYVVFGSSGFTGLNVVRSALEAGFAVRAFVRDPAKLPEELRSKTEVVQGDVLNSDDVKRSVKDQDGVIVALGTRNDLAPTTMMSEGLKNIISAMNETGVKKVSVCVSAFLFFEPGKVPPSFVPITEDHRRMADVLKASSGIDWVAVYPPHIADTPGTNGAYTVTHASESDPPPRGQKVSVQDLGHFLVHCLDNPDHVKQVCAIKS